MAVKPIPEGAFTRAPPASPSPLRAAVAQKRRGCDLVHCLQTISRPVWHEIRYLPHEHKGGEGGAVTIETS
jgi:hypothetical protein